MLEARYIGDLCVAALVAVSSPTHAQARIEVGGYGGDVSTTILQTFDCPPPSSPSDVCASSAEPHDGETHGISLGGYVRYAVVRAVQLEANLMYSRKGYDGSQEVRMHYLEAPILVRFDPFRDWSHARVFAYAGLAPALLLRCHASGIRFDNDARASVPYSDPCGDWPFYPEAPNRFDLGGVLGVGIGWELPFGIIELHARYIDGLIDNGVWGDGGKTVNKAFYVLAGYGRTIGGR